MLLHFEVCRQEATACVDAKAIRADLPRVPKRSAALHVITGSHSACHRAGSSSYDTTDIHPHLLEQSNL